MYSTQYAITLCAVSNNFFSVSLDSCDNSCTLLHTSKEECSMITYTMLWYPNVYVQLQTKETVQSARTIQSLQGNMCYRLRACLISFSDSVNVLQSCSSLLAGDIGSPCILAFSRLQLTMLLLDSVKHQTEGSDANTPVQQQ